MRLSFASISSFLSAFWSLRFFSIDLGVDGSSSGSAGSAGVKLKAGGIGERNDDDEAKEVSYDA